MWRWVLVVFVGCASSSAPYRPQLDAYFAAHPERARAPADVLGTGPWPVGRWATYSRLGERGTRGLDKVSVVAIDPCGTWIKQTSLDDDRQVLLLVCVRQSESLDPLSIVREVRFQGGPDLPFLSVDMTDRAALRDLVGPLVAKLVVSARARGLPGRDHELLEWGDDAHASVVSSLATHGTRLYADRTRRGATHLSLGVGVGYLGGSARHEGDEVASFTLGSGIALTPRLDLIGTVEASMTDASEATDAAMDQTVFVFAAGLRARPWWPRFYLEADLGYAEILQAASTLARGATLSFAIGVDAVVHRGWRASIEARERALVLTQDEGLRHALVVGWTVQLDLR